MIEYKKTTALVVAKIICSVCGTTHSADDFSYQEFFSRQWTAGFGSNYFEDGTSYSIDICEDCFYKAFGTKVENPKEQVLPVFNT